MPYYTKDPDGANDAHLRETVDCRKRPREARECAKARSFMFTKRCRI